MMLNRVDDSQRSKLFSFIRQMVGLQNKVTELTEQLIGSNDDDIPLIRGIYLTSSAQRGQIDDIFTQSAAVQYNLPPAPTHTWPVSENQTWFTGQLVRDVLFSEPNRRRKTVSGCAVITTKSFFLGCHSGGDHRPLDRLAPLL